MENIFEITERIYMALQDEISKKIFIGRFCSSATGDIAFVREIPFRYRNLDANIMLFNERIQKNSLQIKSQG